MYKIIKHLMIIILYIKYYILKKINFYFKIAKLTHPYWRQAELKLEVVKIKCKPIQNKNAT